MSHQGVQAIGIPNIPNIRSDDDLSSKILLALGALEFRLGDGDIIVIASKIVSKAEGRVVIGNKVEISARAREIANDNGFDPVQVELALRESSEVTRSKGDLITETRSGMVCNFSGVDKSNAPQGTYILLPADPDASAKKILGDLERKSGRHLAVIISDTQGRPWRRGSVNIAVGCAGIAPFKYNKGRSDLYGRILQRSTVCQVDEIASLAEPLMGQAGQGVPVVIIRGYAFVEDDDSAKDIVRPKDEDMFR